MRTVFLFHTTPISRILCLARPGDDHFSSLTVASEIKNELTFRISITRETLLFLRVGFTINLSHDRGSIVALI